MLLRRVLIASKCAPARDVIHQVNLLSAAGPDEAWQGLFAMMRLKPSALDISGAKPLAWHLVVLCLALILPIIALGSMLAWSYAEAERARIERNAIENAHEVIAAADREFTDLIATA